MKNLVEVWHFAFATAESGFSQERAGDVQHLKFGFNAHQLATDTTRREMHQMIRTLRFDTQHMRPLPQHARMVFRITHTDAVPADLALPGFETMDEPLKFHFEEAAAPNAVKLKIGDVTTVRPRCRAPPKYLLTTRRFICVVAGRFISGSNLTPARYA